MSCKFHKFPHRPIASNTTSTELLKALCTPTKQLTAPVPFARFLCATTNIRLEMLCTHRLNNSVRFPFNLLFYKITRFYYSKVLEDYIRENKETLEPYDVLNMIRFQKNPEIALQIFQCTARILQFKQLRASYDILIDKLAKAKKFDLIERFLEGLKRRRKPGLMVVVIRLYGRANMPENVLKTFCQMTDYNCRHTVTAFNCLLSALVNSEEYSTAEKMFGKISLFGILPDIYSFNILIRAKCGLNLVDEACEMVGFMEKLGLSADTVTYNTLMNFFCKAGEFGKVYEIMAEMVKKDCNADAATYNIFLTAFCNEGRMSEAMKLLNVMIRNRCVPDIGTYNTLLRGFCGTGMMEVAEIVLSEMPEKGCRPNIFSYCILIEGLCKKGRVDSAYEAFCLILKKKWVVSEDVCEMIIEGLYKTGRFKEAVGMIDEMNRWGFVPGAKTWDALVKSCLNS
ncbi:hypothetical protein SUGI_0589130 [Cryptomeria japonica]|uniref:small ribosomal subunit protein mS79 (rPPR3b) n=1 Tax=Cryptomeria japonica TaxID=3369 RepID=UPI002414755B|nr:small ribosomal subunit protein mS79 (rPPR3b) [Cryptomeria japonica]GLJ29833.1 hypothetical protein SUGI_0589130 [Cryptomeria japonica]